MHAYGPRPISILSKWIRAYIFVPVRILKYSLLKIDNFPENEISYSTCERLSTFKMIFKILAKSFAYNNQVIRY